MTFALVGEGVRYWSGWVLAGLVTAFSIDGSECLLYTLCEDSGGGEFEE